MTLDEATRASRNKRNEGAFFLGKLREVESTSLHNLAEAEEHFDYYLSAFLSANRSVQQILAEVLGWPQIDAVRRGWPAAEQTLERTLTEARNLTVHSGQSSATSTIHYVPQSKVRQEPRALHEGYIIITHPPGVPEIGIGVKKFTIEIEGSDVPAVEACEKYLRLNRQIIDQLGTSP
jgi:hypothetical protein